MKSFFSIVFSLLTATGFAQTVFSYKVIAKDSIEALEKKFVSAYDSRKEFTSAFPNGEKDVLEHWVALQTTFQQHLRENNFSFPEDMRMFLRFYFTNEGNIKHVGYNIQQQLPDETLQQFENHLRTFSDKNSFGMKALVPYVQCGTVTFKNNNAEK